jgi:hypothetical protein
MQTLDKTAWEILNATADDCENLEQIYLQISYELVSEPDCHSDYLYRAIPRAPSLSEVADKIRELVKEGLLQVEMNDRGRRPRKKPKVLRFVWRAWFGMTGRGRDLWEKSEYARESSEVGPTR